MTETMPSAQLVHRGEEFQLIDGNERYEGACLWSWEDAAGGAPQRIAPIYIHARSIQRMGLKRLLPLSSDKKIAVAHQAQALLTARDPSLRFVVVEDMSPLCAPRVCLSGALLHVGKQSLPVASIQRVAIAPLYDVAPADDLWCFADGAAHELTFCNRDTGAREALTRLEGMLPGFDADRALRFAREESVIEDAVTVWPAAPVACEVPNGR
jgi:hypothetical protein